MFRKEIENIEEELQGILSDDRKSWVRTYELMTEVEDGKLYEGKHSSFTAWVNYFAQNRARVHVSLLWERMKAGRFYAKYSETKKGNAPALNEVHVAPASLVLADKIAGNNQQVANELVDKILSGNLKRADLKNAWQTVKAQREEAGHKAVRQNVHDADEVSTSDSKGILKAADIVASIARNSDWIRDIKESRYSPSKYKIFTEFAVQTGTSHNARRMDVLVVESLSTDSKTNEVVLHGIEIKVSKSDLLNDHKMQEYGSFCDYFWIAVPEELEKDARSIMIDGWGLLLCKDGVVSVAVPAGRHEAPARYETITRVLVKLL